MREWGRSRAVDLAALCELALPGERLTVDELESCCWDDSCAGAQAVLADPYGTGAVAVSVATAGEHTVGFVKLLAVEPARQGLGHGRRLLEVAEAWAWDHGATEMRAGASAPFYLWPGIDVHMTRALCLFESAGYSSPSAAINMSCPTTHRAKPPDGVVVRRVIDDADRDATLAFVAREWDNWVPEASRGIDHGACVAAFGTGPVWSGDDDSDAGDGAASSAASGSADGDGGGTVVGFACHSVNRAGWVGPMGTRPRLQRSGVGRALLGEVCKDLMVAGLTDAEISWVGPVAFYAKATGAAVSRVFRSAVRRRP
jgi:GNAT superfamily N-acetyltransferase